ncbi:hypothetical protein WJX77_001536 [Trebouxia sp. C0004]
MASTSEPSAYTEHSQHFTRSQTRLHYKAAGVLPFSFQHGSPVILLGAELAKTGPQGKMYKTMWRDFGGQREAIDPDSETTASREFAEETMGLFGGCEVNGSSVAACSRQMHSQLIQRQHVLKVVHQLKKGEYHMYVAQTPHIDPLMFHLALQQNAETDAVDGAEKTAFAWVALSDLLAATSVCAKRYFLNAHVHTTGNGRQPVVHGPRSMQLHPCFANSLRLAQDAGLLALVAAAQIADIPLHAQSAAGTSGLQQLPYKEGYSMGMSAAGQEPHALQAFAHTVKAAVSKQRGARGGRRAARKRISGITPEHMLYWVLQADIAVQLRCEDNDCVVSMAKESDMPSESDAAEVLEAGDAAVAIMDIQPVPLPEAAQKQLSPTMTKFPSKLANQHNKRQPACAQRTSQQKECC